MSYAATTLRGRVHVVRAVHVTNLPKTIFETGPSLGRRRHIGPWTRTERLEARRGNVAADRLVRHAGRTAQIWRLYETAAELGRVGRDGQRQIREYTLHV